ncbi:hypothetical protein ACNR9Q_00440 [Maribacter sp. X9]|uniref:hypothetical protein n=1 Tax=Maribacter sp. X9 TaxID=3402159 RepID=UPI003AF3C0FD
MKYIDKFIRNEIKSDEKMIWEWILITLLIIGVLWFSIVFFSLSYWVGYGATAIILLTFLKINIELSHSKKDWREILYKLENEQKKENEKKNYRSLPLFDYRIPEHKYELLKNVEGLQIIFYNKISSLKNRENINYQYYEEYLSTAIRDLDELRIVIIQHQSPQIQKEFITIFYFRLSKVMESISKLEYESKKLEE